MHGIPNSESQPLYPSGQLCIVGRRSRKFRNVLLWYPLHVLLVPGVLLLIYSTSLQTRCFCNPRICRMHILWAEKHQVGCHVDLRRYLWLRSQPWTVPPRPYDFIKTSLKILSPMPSYWPLTLISRQTYHASHHSFAIGEVAYTVHQHVPTSSP